MVSIGRSNRHRLHVAALGLIVALSGTTCALARPKVDDPPKAQQPAANHAESAKALAPPRRAQNIPATKPEAKPDQKAAKEDGDGIELGSWPDWVIVAFTAFLAWLSWRQHELEKRLAADTADSLAIAKQSADAATSSAQASAVHASTAADSLSILKIQLRAFMNVVSFDSGVTRVVIDGVAQDCMVVRANYRNEGLSTARDVRIVIGGQVSPPGVDPTFTAIDTVPGPDISTQGAHKSSPIYLKRNVVDEVFANRIDYYLHIHIEYKTIFDDDVKVTQSCAKLIIYNEPSTWFGKVDTRKTTSWMAFGQRFNRST